MIGGMGVMVLGAAASGLLLGVLAIALRRPLGWITAFAGCGFVWSILVIALVTLVPAQADVGVVPAETRSMVCSMDYGGPAPDGFWIFDGAQRTLNTVLFVPAGVCWVLLVSRWRGWLGAAIFGLVALAAYSIGIEWTQLELARIDRACDVTDVVDNVTGAAIGVGVGSVIALALHPWRYADRNPRSPH